MRAVMHWFRSAAIVGGLSALPCGQAAPSLTQPLGGTHPLALASVATVAAAAPAERSPNFLEASTPINLSSLRHGVRDAVAPNGAARAEIGVTGFGPAGQRPDEPAAPGSVPLDRNSLLALALATLGLMALAAARAPGDQGPEVAEAKAVAGEPAGR